MSRSQLLRGCVEFHCFQCKNSQYRFLGQYPSKMYDFLDAVAPFHHSPIWRRSQICAAAQIQTDGRNLTKLFAHFLDTQIQLLDQRDPRDPTGNPLKKGSLSENATKRRRRRQKINRRASRCGDLELSADLLALIVFEPQHFP